MEGSNEIGDAEAQAALPRWAVYGDPELERRFDDDEKLQTAVSGRPYAPYLLTAVEYLTDNRTSTAQATEAPQLPGPRWVLYGDPLLERHFDEDGKLKAAVSERPYADYVLTAIGYVRGDTAPVEQAGETSPGGSPSSQIAAENGS